MTADDAPVFLYVGGEGPQTAPTASLFMVELAKAHGAWVVALEHRYYGESYPTPDMADDNLKYLHSEQALADLAQFVRFVKGDLPDDVAVPALDMPFSVADSKWVTFGGSYPGALSLWAKLEYPDLLAGCVGSSAPVYAEENFEQYAQVVALAMSTEAIGGSNACVQDVQAAMDTLAVNVTAKGVAEGSTLPAELMPCAPFDATSDEAGELDLSTYQATLFGYWQGTVQYNNDHAGAVTVSDMCAAVSEAGGGLPGLAAASALVAGEGECVASSFQNDMIAAVSNITFDGESSYRQWIWQSCREFGYFQTTADTAGTPFSSFASVNVQNAAVAICDAAFNGMAKARPQVALTNVHYGGRKYKGEQATIPTGSLDPWVALGIVNQTSPFLNSCGGLYCPEQSVPESSTVVELINTAHCRDMYATQSTDPETVTWAHGIIAANVASYIA